MSSLKAGDRISPAPMKSTRAGAPSTAGSLSRPDWLCLALLAGGVLLTYSAALGCGFVNFDDWQYVTSNPAVLTGLSWHGFRWAWTTSYAANWHPLTWLSLMLDATLFGRAWGYHLTNMLFHLANTLLVFVLLRRMTGAVWRSTVVAALFAVHPLHVESVAWVSERKDVLSSFFGLLALLAYVRYTRRPALARYLLVVFATVLSLLAKPMWVTLPGMLLLLDYWPLRRILGSPKEGPNCPVSLKRALLEKAPLLALAAASSVLTLWSQRRGGAFDNLASVPFADRLGNAVVSYGQYLRQTALPYDLACYYPYPVGGPNRFAWIAAALMLLGMTAATVRWGRQCPYLPVGWLWYLGTLVPVIGVVSFGFAARADRYSYIPLIGIFVAVVWGMTDLARWLGKSRQVSTLAIAFLACCMIASWLQVRVWTNSVTLWERDNAVTGGNEIAYCNLGLVHWSEGDRRKAVKDFERALTFNPDYAPAHGNLGVLRLEQGRVDDAIREFELACRTDAEPAQTHGNLGKALMRQGRYTEAVQHFEESLRLQPSNDSIRELDALALFRLGHLKQATAQLTEALERNPNAAGLWHDRGLVSLLGKDPVQAEKAFRRAVELEPGKPVYHCGLGEALYALGRHKDARAEYQEASRLDPGWRQAVLAQAWAFATAALEWQRDGARAVFLADQARQAFERADAPVMDVVAAAYAEAGRFAEAVSAAEEAHSLAASAGNTDLANEIAERIALYRKHQPYHVQAPVSADSIIEPGTHTR